MRLIETEFQISDKELKQAFPELYTEYKKLYGSKRPKINVEVVTEYTFKPSVTDFTTDYYVPIVYFFYQNGDIAYYDASVSGGEGNMPFGKYSLGANDCVLEAHTGHHEYCYLKVNPSFINQNALPEPIELTPAQEYVLLIYYAIKSAFRRSTFFRYTFNNKVTQGNNFAYSAKDMIDEIKHEYGTTDLNEAYDYIVEDLVSKGLISPSNRVTPEGVNTAIRLSKSGNNRPYK